MARVNYSEIEQNVSTSNSSTSEYKVGFFNIKPNEEAIVRFMINSLEDFEIYSVHPITVGQSSFPNRKVSCSRNATDPLNVCPLCAAGEKVQQRIYIKMIQYVNDNGRIIPKAVVWDRPARAYAPQLKSYLDNYGPLTNIVCKITRTGTGLDTRYDIIPNLNPQMYNEQIYVKDFSSFNDFSVLGGMILDKTAEEIQQFISTGNFPQNISQNNAPVNNMSANNVATNTNFDDDIPVWNPMPKNTNQQNNMTNNNIPNSQPSMGRPVRYY